MTTTQTRDLVSQIMDYELGELDDYESLQLFSHLIESGMVWSLQGHYGRTASHLIENGILDPETGEISQWVLDELGVMVEVEPPEDENAQGGAV